MTAALCLFGTAANAQTKAELERAKMLFDAGATFYASGQFIEAAEAFDQANQLIPRPAIVFSLAQAYRRQFFIDKNNVWLRLALQNYRLYISEVPEGGRRVESAQALDELAPYEELMRTSDPSSGTMPSREKSVARLLVTSQTPGAIVTIDNTVSRPAPFAPEVPLGRHKVRVSAPGYFSSEEDIEAVDGNVVVSVNLVEKPAKIMITTGAGTVIILDGQVIDTAPLTKPIEIPSGKHILVLSKHGYGTVGKELNLHRGEERRFDLPLKMTVQNKVGTGLIIGGSAILVAGGIFSIAALVEQGKAIRVKHQTDSSKISIHDIDNYYDARDGRLRWARLGLLSFIGGAVTVGTGIAIHALDNPSRVVNHVSAPNRPNTKNPPPVVRSSDMMMRLQPVFTPSLIGGIWEGHF